jgi:hypothetical protein
MAQPDYCPIGESYYIGGEGTPFIPSDYSTSGTVTITDDTITIDESSTARSTVVPSLPYEDQRYSIKANFYDAGFVGNISVFFPEVRYQILIGTFSRVYWEDGTTTDIDLSIGYIGEIVFSSTRIGSKTYAHTITVAGTGDVVQKTVTDSNNTQILEFGISQGSRSGGDYLCDITRLETVGLGLPNDCLDLDGFEYIGKYNVSLNLAMVMRNAWVGVNTIFDWGSTADTYTFEGDIITTNYDIWERLSSNASSVKLNAEGFYPFGTHFLGDVYGTRYPRYIGKSNFHGSFQQWGGEMIPDSSGGYTYDNTVWVAPNVTGFGIAGLSNFPMPICTPNSEYSITYDRAGNVVREYDRGENTERRQFSIKWNNMCGDALRSMLYQITSVIRGNTFKIDFGSNLQRLSPWKPRDGEILSGEYDIRLSSPVIDYTYIGGGLWELTIEVIKWEQ